MCIYLLSSPIICVYVYFNNHKQSPHIITIILTPHHRSLVLPPSGTSHCCALRALVVALGSSSLFGVLDVKRSSGDESVGILLQFKSLFGLKSEATTALCKDRLNKHIELKGICS